MPRLFQVANVGLVVLAAACVPAAASVPSASAHLRVANELVLSIDDVKSGATVTVDRALNAADAVEILGIPGATTDLFARNGFANAYVRAFAWNDPSLVVTRALASATYLFADPAGVHETMSLFIDAAGGSGAGRMSLGATLGDESAGFQIDSDLTDTHGASVSVTTTGVAFRHANALTLVSYRAPSEEDDPKYVIALARRQLDMQKAVAPAGVPILAAAALPARSEW